MAVAHRGAEQEPGLRQHEREAERRARAAAGPPPALPPHVVIRVAQRGERLPSPALLVEGPGLLGPLLCGLAEHVQQRDLGALGAAVAVRDREADALAPAREAGGVLVGIAVRVALRGAAAREGDGDAVLAHGLHRAQLGMLAPSQQRDAQAQPSAGSGFAAKASSATGRPPIRCSWMMRSSTSGVQPRYQVPSGYTTAIGPSRQIRKHQACVR